MPRSPQRRKSAYTPPPAKAPVSVTSPAWVPALMVALFVIGLLWIVTYYVTSTEYPIPGIDVWNMLIGFGFVIAGFVVSTQWK
ncbi:cell division protein CrgA [Vallicoccus soli]|uniref:Cell division protein CrgA n=1 Tax=Vallicoccus soli TaxID=2339232 RepID=A0A3A3YVD0_9ACTN|nr:cell division protein CrgA [Vallicoccus soli]RJK94719.1 cell division protein CrgA [Vallicoccus soli]